MCSSDLNRENRENRENSSPLESQRYLFCRIPDGLTEELRTGLVDTVGWRTDADGSDGVIRGVQNRGSDTAYALFVLLDLLLPAARVALCQEFQQPSLVRLSGAQIAMLKESLGPWFLDAVGKDIILNSLDRKSVV